MTRRWHQKSLYKADAPGTLFFVVIYLLYTLLGVFEVPLPAQRSSSETEWPPILWCIWLVFYIFVGQESMPLLSTHARINFRTKGNFWLNPLSLDLSEFWALRPSFLFRWRTHLCCVPVRPAWFWNLKMSFGNHTNCERDSAWGPFYIFVGQQLMPLLSKHITINSRT